MITEDHLPSEGSAPAGAANPADERPAAPPPAPDPAPTRGEDPNRRLILFGAFDRHNFGDLLLAHCAAARHPGRKTIFAGLAERDLTPFGGHRVCALAEVVERYGDEPADFIHVGGEVLTTTAWEAAVMLQSPADAARAIAGCERNPNARDAWATQVLGTRRRIPYVIDARDLPPKWDVRLEPVGGVGFERLPAVARDEVVGALAHASALEVRDATTQAALARAGIAAPLAPDAAAATARLCGERIASAAWGGALRASSVRMPRWIALQLAAERGDDATLDRIAAAVAERLAGTGIGVALFCAGLAPWHDDPATLQRLSGRIAEARVPVALFESADVFALCALLAGSCGYFGTSLHGWIVATSFGVPAHCLVHRADDKAAAYLDSWMPDRRRWRTLREADLLPALRDTG